MRNSAPPPKLNRKVRGHDGTVYEGAPMGWGGSRALDISKVDVLDVTGTDKAAVSRRSCDKFLMFGGFTAEISPKRENNSLVLVNNHHHNNK